MPVQINETAILVETVALEPAAFREGVRDPGYPYPRLASTGRPESASLRGIELVDEGRKATICLDLGGRLVGFGDPGTLRLEPLPSGPRGIEFPFGIAIHTGKGALAPVDAMPQGAEEDSDEATVVCHDLILGTPLSLHWVWAMTPERAGLTLRIKAFNRSLLPYEHQLGLEFGEGEVRSVEGGAIWTPTTSGAIAVAGQLEWCDGRIALFEDPRDARFGPRETKSWELTLVPVPREPEWCQVGPLGALAVGSELTVASFQPLKGTVSIDTEQGQRLDAAIDIRPGQIWSAELGEHRPHDVALSAAQGRMLWPQKASNWDVMATVHGFRQHAFREAVEAFCTGGDPNKSLMTAQADVALRSACHLVRAMLAARHQDWERARAELDDALLTNNEDHLLWWLKARVSYLAQDADDQLANAHFLAPMEPLLRAEGLLRQPYGEGFDANPILAPLAGHPDAMLEVVERLLECGLSADAARWIDECQRHSEVPLLRYRLADALLDRPGMEAEAALHVTKATPAPLAPPFPWRVGERRAVQRLAQRFPRDERLRTLAELISDSNEHGDSA